jgi:hypothetical protein
MCNHANRYMKHGENFQHYSNLQIPLVKKMYLKDKLQTLKIKELVKMLQNIFICFKKFLNN